MCQICYNDAMNRTEDVRRLLTAKTSRRVSLRQISRDTKVSVSTISRFIDGHSIMSETVDKLAAWIERDDQQIASQV